MTSYKTGDLVAFRWPGRCEPLKVGIILNDTHTTFTIKWFWCDKTFYMEDMFDDAKELNKIFILDIVQYEKKSSNICIEILSPTDSSYKDGTQTDRCRTIKENY